MTEEIGSSGTEESETEDNQNQEPSPNIKIGLRHFSQHLAGGFINHSSHDKDLYVGDGLSSMTSLAFMVDHANISGVVLPRTLLRDAEDGNADIYLEREIREILHKAATTRNRVESARNIVEVQLNQAEKDSENRSLPKEKQAAAQKLFQSINSIAFSGDLHKRLEDSGGGEAYRVIKALFDAALKDIDKKADSLPSDMGRAKERLSAMLEAKASEHITNMTNAKTQQGVDLPPSCLDQKTAVEKVGTLRQTWQLQIEMAGTIDLAKAAYISAVELIENVTVLNTPLYAHQDYSVIETDTVRATVDSGNRFRMMAKHPRVEPKIEGIISVTTSPITVPSNGRATVQPQYKSSVFDHTRIEFYNTSAESHFWSVLARNICGPSRRMVIEVRPATT